MNLVQNYRNRRKYHRINPDGTFEPMSAGDVTDKAANMRTVGLGDVVSTVSGQGRLGVAIYVYGSELRLLIGKQHFNLLDVGIRVIRTTTPFLKAFEIIIGSERSLRFWYFWIDLFEDPFYGTRDILKFACELSESRERSARFFFVWQATSNGDDLTSPAVKASIEEAVAKAIS